MTTTQTAAFTTSAITSLDCVRINRLTYVAMKANNESQEALNWMLARAKDNLESAKAFRTLATNAAIRSEFMAYLNL